MYFKFCLQLNVGNIQFFPVSLYCFLALARLERIHLIAFLFFWGFLFVSFFIFVFLLSLYNEKFLFV